ncbi:MAG: ATP-binding protein [Ignavibacterium sp.]|nr:ATP-binding protein [Ignavibacterium sp.]
MNGENKEEYYELIKRNSEKLQELIDQLLELTQLENAAIPLKAKQLNLVSLLRGLLFAFDSLAKQNDLELSFHSTEERIICWIDNDKLEKIINNLLSNAVKFTPAKGVISIIVKKTLLNGNEVAVIKVSDTGIGIPKDKLANIFDRFYQVDDSTRKKYGGSGIGLALVKELVDLHKWNIEVRSDFGKGTEFILSIPISDAYLSEQEKVVGQVVDSEKEAETDWKLINEASEPIEIEIEKEIQEKQKLLDAKPLILIVEDSEDVRSYLTGLLKNDYRISEAIDGVHGIKKATEVMPDLIISDVMMPSMNGMELCRKIKTDWQTSHIPVILLTAKASPESKIEGLETGADDYLTKPFSSKELFVRIKNLLEQRKSLREKFSKEIKVEPASIAVTSLDNEFLKKAFDVAEQNLSNTEFNSEAFAKEMFLSRSQLHRKLLAVTGQAPGEFVRTYRLKKAASFILEKRLSVTQIAFEVGFSSPSHFTKAFRQQFNCSPTEFKI